MSVRPPYYCTPEELPVIREALNLACDDLNCGDFACRQGARIAKLLEKLLIERDSLRTQLELAKGSR